jgi:hypothetical protein
VEMWSVSAITLFSLTRRVSCFLLTFNADTHFGCVSLVTHGCDVPRFVQLSCRRRNSSPRRASSVCSRRPECQINVGFGVTSLRKTGQVSWAFRV